MSLTVAVTLEIACYGDVGQVDVLAAVAYALDSGVLQEEIEHADMRVLSATSRQVALARTKTPRGAGR